MAKDSPEFQAWLQVTIDKKPMYVKHSTCCSVIRLNILFFKLSGSILKLFSHLLIFFFKKSFYNTDVRDVYQELILLNIGSESTFISVDQCSYI